MARNEGSEAENFSDLDAILSEQVGAERFQVKHLNPEDPEDFALIWQERPASLMPDDCAECCKSAEFCDCGGDDEF